MKADTRRERVEAHKAIDTYCGYRLSHSNGLTLALEATSSASADLAPVAAHNGAAPSV